jgi:hypothetical protein
MSYRGKRILPLVGMLLLCGYAAFAVIRSGNKVQEVKQPLPSSVGDLAAVKLVEIKDAAGQVVLSGSFVVENKQDGDVEGKALLTGTGVNAAAKGEAEFDVSTNKNGSTEKELEISVRKLSPGASFSLFLDEQQVATFYTNGRGAAELEMKDAPAK